MGPGETFSPSLAILFPALPFLFSSLQNTVFSYIILPFGLSLARTVFLSNPVPALGKWKRNLYSPCLEGFLPVPWGLTHRPVGMQPGLLFPGLWVLFSNQGPC